MPRSCHPQERRATVCPQPLTAALLQVLLQNANAVLVSVCGKVGRRACFPDTRQKQRLQKHSHASRRPAHPTPPALSEPRARGGRRSAAQSRFSRAGSGAGSTGRSGGQSTARRRWLIPGPICDSSSVQLKALSIEPFNASVGLEVSLCLEVSRLQRE